MNYAIGDLVTPTGVLVSPVTDHDDPSWHTTRKGGIGASEIAAVLGIDPWTDSVGLWLSKTGRVDGKDTNEAMSWGNLLEGPIADEYGRRNEVDVLPAPGVLAHQDTEWMLCSPDRMLAAPGDDRPFSLVEVKNVSGWKADGWDSDEGLMPMHYLAQVQWQLGVTGYDTAAVACLVGGQKFESLTVYREDDLIAMMRERAAEFWELLLADKEPAWTNTALAADALRQVRAAADSTVQIDAEVGLALLDRLTTAKAEASIHRAALKAAEANVKLIEGEIRHLMVDAASATFRDEFGADQDLFRITTTNRSGYYVAPTSYTQVKAAR